MATRFGNVKGIKFLEEPAGADKGGVALVTFDLNSAAYTGGVDTVTLGGSGSFDHGVATTDTLAGMLQKRRRDGKTVTITSVCQGPVPGLQAAATNGPAIFPQAQAVSANNVTSVTLHSAPTAGSAITAAASAWERAMSLCIFYQAV